MSILSKATKSLSTHLAPNWIHLDLKGVIPLLDELLFWLAWLKDAGFNGVVWEYEDRLPWITWPNTFRAGYSLDDWQTIWGRCRELDLEVVPLVQTHGHLEWLLEHDEYASWREDGHLNEICPQHPHVLPALKRWLDEVIDLHPDGELLHVGGDETWYLGSCEKCRDKANSSPHGKMSLYLEHLNAVCRYVLARGKRPMLWADAFWPQEHRGLVCELPPEVVLVDWQYGWQGPTEATPGLGQAGHDIWAAPAIRCSYGQIHALGPIGERVKNIEIWRPQAEEGRVAGILHTTWARAGSLGPLYGPWEGWLPAFIAAGDAPRWHSHVLKPFVNEVEAAIRYGAKEEINNLIERLGAVETEEVLTLRCIAWWQLALRHRTIQQDVLNLRLTLEGERAVRWHRGEEPDRWEKLAVTRQTALLKLDEWEDEAREYWRALSLSDEDEYFAGRVGSLRTLLCETKLNDDDFLECTA